MHSVTSFHVNCRIQIQTPFPAGGFGQTNCGPAQSDPPPPPPSMPQVFFPSVLGGWTPFLIVYHRTHMTSHISVYLGYAAIFR